MLVATVERRRVDAAELLAAARAVEPGHSFTGNSQGFTRLGAWSGKLMVTDSAGCRRDLRREEDLARMALAVGPPAASQHAGLLANLGSALRDRFEQRGDLHDLDEAIEVVGNAVAITFIPQDKAMFQSNLGALYRMRFDRTDDQVDLDRAVAVGAAAVEQTEQDDPARAGRELDLGASIATLWSHAGKLPADADKAIRLWQCAAASRTAAASARLRAARNWAKLAFQSRADKSEALEGYISAITLLPIVAWRGVDQTSRLRAMAQAYGLGADVAACAIVSGRPTLAVELIEQARGVFWSQLVDMRTDVSALRTVAPGLFTKLNRVRATLDPGLGLE